ncbi:MAG: hypothetical protein FJZ01_06710 [Candidatus Sericytochromatia bacterium]|nr:hypothetical protein [Candidatus Tanganyikabacteria bacterium]
MKSNVLALAVLGAAAGCALPAQLLQSQPSEPPVISGRVYGLAAGRTAKVAIREVVDDAPGAIIDYAPVAAGGYKYTFPRTFNEEFDLIAFDDANSNGRLDAGEATSEGARCGSIRVLAPARRASGNVSGKWQFWACDEDAPFFDFSEADIRFVAESRASSEAASPSPTPRPTPRPGSGGGVGGEIG